MTKRGHGGRGVIPCHFHPWSLRIDACRTKKTKVGNIPFPGHSTGRGPNGGGIRMGRIDDRPNLVLVHQLGQRMFVQGAAARLDAGVRTDVERNGRRPGNQHGMAHLSKTSGNRCRVAGASQEQDHFGPFLSDGYLGKWGVDNQLHAHGTTNGSSRSSSRQAA